MHRYDINQLIQWRLKDQPKDSPIPAKDDYWCKLLMKGHKTPKELTVGEAFELGVYVERIFQCADENFALEHALGFRRYLNGKLGK